MKEEHRQLLLDNGIVPRSCRNRSKEMKHIYLMPNGKWRVSLYIQGVREDFSVHPTLATAQRVRDIALQVKKKADAEAARVKAARMKMEKKNGDNTRPKT